MTAAADKASVTMYVDVEPALAFEIFTTEIDRWWRRGPAYRVAGKTPGVIHLEPRLGGRILEAHGTDRPIYDIGVVTAWEPPAYLAFDWRAVSFVPGETTRVEVRFVPSRAGTRVVLEHHGWATIRPDHEVRHGQPSAAFLAELGMWWASLLRGFSEHATRERP